METLKKQFDAHRLIVISVGAVVHVTNVCIVGFCGDKDLLAFEPSLSSTIFTLGVLFFFTEFQVLPDNFAFQPNAVVKLIVETILCLLMANVALKLMWLPFEGFMINSCIFASQVLKDLHEFLGLKTKLLLKGAGVLDSHLAFTIISVVFAMSFFVILLFSSNFFMALKELACNVETWPMRRIRRHDPDYSKKMKNVPLIRKLHTTDGQIEEDDDDS